MICGAVLSIQYLQDISIIARYTRQGWEQYRCTNQPTCILYIVHSTHTHTHTNMINELKSMRLSTRKTNRSILEHNIQTNTQVQIRTNLRAQYRPTLEYACRPTLEYKCGLKHKYRSTLEHKYSPSLEHKYRLTLKRKFRPTLEHE